MSDAEYLAFSWESTCYPLEEIAEQHLQMQNEIIFLRKLSFLLYYINRNDFDLFQHSQATELITEAKQKYGYDLSGLKGE